MLPFFQEDFIGLLIILLHCEFWIFNSPVVSAVVNSDRLQRKMVLTYNIWVLVFFVGCQIFLKTVALASRLQELCEVSHSNPGYKMASIRLCGTVGSIFEDRYANTGHICGKSLVPTPTDSDGQSHVSMGPIAHPPQVSPLFYWWSYSIREGLRQFQKEGDGLAALLKYREATGVHCMHIFLWHHLLGTPL